MNGDETNGDAPQAQLVITLSANGQIQITGPIENLVLTYGLLETAKDTIRRHAEQPPSPIALARGIPKQFMR